LAILEQPSCGYDIRAMGSFAKRELCPYSDLEYMILIENEENRDEFQILAQFLDIQITSLGSWGKSSVSAT
jgi:hypothetical protein